MNGSIIVTGGTGFLGRAVIDRLSSVDNRPLIAAVRSLTTAFPPEVKLKQIGGLGADTDWMDCLRGVEVVVHCAGRAHVIKAESPSSLTEYRKINVQGTLALARQSARAGVLRFVFISSTKVNGERTASNQRFSVDDVPAPKDPYGISKLEAERGLNALARETGMEVVIIRPPLVYGPAVKGNFATMVSWLRNGLPLPFGAVNNQRSLVALENLVDFIALCANRERSQLAANELFLISDGEDVSTTQLLRKVARAYGVTPRLMPVKTCWLEAVFSLLGKRDVANRLLGSLVVDSSKVRDVLGWTPVVSMDEQLRKMAIHDKRV